MECIVNGKIIRNNLNAYSRPVAFMVKANAYGHGLKIVDYVDDVVAAYGVATEEEGVLLRRSTSKPILVTAPNVKNARLILDAALTPMVSDKEEMARVNDLANKPTVVHLKVDSGMGRFGAKRISETVDNAIFAKSLKNVRVKGIATHFSSYDALFKQVERFSRHIAAAESVTGKLLTHAGSSSTAIATDYDLIRIGYAAYSNAMKVTSTIAYVKKLKKGESVGYGERYVAEKPVSVAVVYGGYADGIRTRSIGYKVLINGKRQPIIAVCMDVFMVELSTKAKIGDEVTVINGEKDVLEMAKTAGVIPYEVYVGFVGRTKITYDKRS
ncbi:MAG: alanine racemase [Clostridia bacterium]|nr:alanine racemase [Clostridia bacterium]